MSFIVKAGLSAVVLIFAVPGLIIEPGPLSEIAALVALGAIWDFDLGLGGDS